MRLSIIGFSVASGLTWSLGIFMAGLASLYFDWGGEFIKVVASAYIGFQATLLGSLIGAAWGFVDAFIGGLVFVLIYNAVIRCCCKSCA
jgi:hypothetical protein